MSFSRSKPDPVTGFHVHLVCQYAKCGKPFLAERSALGRKFCSEKCYHDWRGIKVNSLCRKCGKTFQIAESVVKKGSGFFCSKECYHRYNRGKNHPTWRGGRVSTPYDQGFNKKLKERIRQRDNYKCGICQCPQLEFFQKLDIHHIDYNKKNNVFQNLIALCRRCHTATSYRRNYWINYFKKRKPKMPHPLTHYYALYENIRQMAMYSKHKDIHKIIIHKLEETNNEFFKYIAEARRKARLKQS